MPKISIIIPAYNVESYIRECLDKIISQTLQDIEIICINDGSTDQTLEIIKEYASKDNRIQIINQENQGAGIARNNGIKSSNSEYIAFMDPDDYYPSVNILELLYTKATNNNAVICGGALAYIEDSGLKKGHYKEILFETEGFIPYIDYQFDFFYQRFIYKTTFIKENNLYFPYYRRYQDPPFFVKAMNTAGKFYAIPDVTYAYRKSNNTQTTNIVKMTDFLKGYTDELFYAKANNLGILYKSLINRLNTPYHTKLLMNVCFKFNKIFFRQMFRLLAQIDIEQTQIKLNKFWTFWYFLEVIRKRLGR